ncbi:hypothetical protein UC35_05130 [Ramlibacter tataouinensis]|uniref:DUF3999 domain-containing protein n=2 Tax=Ramlibacter tataouinensis TaxID=94132 RepID=A0A127JR59_9BURK|nr:hypothetical protein UC35_05130 [Ramlibacter tataouinensis]
MSVRFSRGAAALLALHAALAWAEGPPQDEFAWRAPLQAPAGASLVRVELPAQALARLQSVDARDVRVFNAAGEAVPYAWIQATPAGKPPEEKTRSYPGLPLYATNPGTTASRGAVEVKVEGERGRESVWVRMQGEPAADARRLHSSLFAMGDERKPLSAIELQAQLPANTPVRVTASTSSDLASWTPAPVRGRLYRFEGEGAPSNLRLDFTRPITLENRYLRLDWQGQDGVSIAAAMGILAAAVPPRRTRIELGAWRQTAPDTVEIATGFATPIAAIALSTPRDNTLVPVRVLGRSDDSQPWRQLGQTVVYRLVDQGETMTNPPLELQSSTPSLRIVAANGTALAPAQLQAFVEFTPRQLVFVASGSGPFVLAAGRERTAAAALGAATITGMLGERKAEDLPLAQPGAAVEARPSRWAALWPGAPGTPAVLWAVLGLGVLLLAAVAWTLLRQMNAASRAGGGGP